VAGKRGEFLNLYFLHVTRGGLLYQTIIHKIESL
jgi:hypothetical protein